MSRELLIELVKRYSPSYEERPAVEFLVDWMNAHGLQAHVDPIGNAFGSKGSPQADHTLMLLGHIDTVQGEIPVRVEDDILYGRGSVDAKGPLCAFAAAAAAADLPSGWRVIVVGALEEEVATSKGAYYIREQFTPDYCIIGEPSGANRVTLGYKGRLQAEYWYRQELTHSAVPEPTAAAIGVGYWNQVLHWANTFNADKDKYFDRIMPNLRAINSEEDDFYETLRMVIGFRLPPSLSPGDVTDALLEFLNDEARLRTFGAEDAYQSDKNNPLVRKMIKAIRANGNRPGYVLKTGTSDMNVVGAVWNCPIIAYGPGDSSLDHTPNEHISLGEYDSAVDTLKTLFQNL